MSTTPELAIRIARTAFNRALADGDPMAIGPLLIQMAVLVTGSDSAIISGRKAQLAIWKQEFEVRDRAIYTRTPETVIVSPVEPIAFENGAWRSTSASGEAILASGTYTAKWRQIGSDWLIEAELYLTLT